MPTDNIEILVEAKVGQALKNLGMVEKKTEGMGKKTQKTSALMKTAWMGVAGILTSVVVGAFNKAINMASDFEEANQKFAVTFRGVSKEANAMRKELINSYNLSSLAATELMSNTGDLLSGFGFTGEKALELSGEVNKLAADLSSFANVPVTQASEAISKGLLGERESMKSLGIAIMEADVQQELYRQGKQNLTGMALKQAKAEATLKLALQQSANAIGDSARSADSHANIMRKLKNVFSDITVGIGQGLIEQFEPLTRGLKDVASSEKGINKLAVAVRVLVLGFSLATASVRTLFNIFQTLFSPLMQGMKGIAEAYATLTDSSKSPLERLKALKGVTVDVFKGIKDDAIQNGKDIVDGYVKVKDNLVGIFNDPQIVKGLDIEMDGDAGGPGGGGDTGGGGGDKNAQKRLEQFAKLNDEITSREKDTFEKRREMIDELVEYYKTIEGSEGILAQLHALRLENEDQAEEEAFEKRKSRFQSNLDMAGQVANGISGFTNAMYENQIKAAEGNEKKQKELKRRQARTEKAFGIFSATLDLAKAISSAFAWTPGGVIVKSTSAAIASGIAALNLAAVAATPLPKFAQGTPPGGFITSGPQLMMVGDNASGRERVTVDPLDSRESGGSGNTYIFNGIQDIESAANAVKEKHGVNFLES